MKQHQNFIKEALWLTLSHLVLGALAARVFFSLEWAIFFGIILAGIMAALYLWFIYMEIIEAGLPWSLLFLISPVVWATGVAIWWVVRWVLERLEAMRFP